MNGLYRDLAPISSAAWEEIEEEAKRTLKTRLAARRVVDFEGPKGWDKSAVNLGRSDALRAGPANGVDARIRQVQPLTEFRAVFELSRDELEAIDRGATDAELGPVVEAAVQMATAEDRAVFHGYGAGNIAGIMERAEVTLKIPPKYEDYPGIVSAAVSDLRASGVDGPYVIALGPDCYQGLTKTTVGGYPVYEHVRRLVDGNIVWAPAINGAVVASMRGGDFELTVGQDFSIGYLDHDQSKVRLYLQESLTFRVLGPEAAVALVYPKKK